MPLHVLRTILADPGWPPGDRLQQIEEDRATVDRLVFLLEPTLAAASIRPASWEPYVTWTRKASPVSWHFDKELGRSRHKLYVYLNDAPGTIFDQKHRHQVAGEAGTVVLFPIDLEHCGAPNPDGVLKQVVGLRPVL